MWPSHRSYWLRLRHSQQISQNTYQSLPQSTANNINHQNRDSYFRNLITKYSTEYIYIYILKTEEQWLFLFTTFCVMVTTEADEQKAVSPSDLAVVDVPTPSSIVEISCSSMPILMKSN